MKAQNTIKYILTILITLFIFSTFLTTITSAQGSTPPTEKTSEQIKSKLVKTAEAQGAGYKSGNIIDTIAIIVKTILSLLGIFFLILVIMGGFQWMSAGGNEETVTKARKRIIDASIGLAIIIFSYMISMFIISLFNTTPV